MFGKQQHRTHSSPHFVFECCQICPHDLLSGILLWDEQCMRCHVNLDIYMSTYCVNFISSLLPYPQYAWGISAPVTLGNLHGWHPLPVPSFLFCVPSSSLLLFLLCSFCRITSTSLSVRVCVSFFLFGKKAECLGSINPLNAIKHAMHRRRPFKT